MLPKFSEEGDAYLFLSEFEEVCSMMQFPNMSRDVVRLHFIPIALKDSAKKWMHSLPTNSISTWDGFVSVFLRKYFPNGKTVKLRNEINHLCNLRKSHFGNALKDLNSYLLNVPTMV